MNVVEIIMLICALVILAIYYKKGQYGKYTWIYFFFSIPVLFFSINMVTESMTIDEYGYMLAFSDIENIQNYFQPLKAVYEYRTSQMIFGTLMKIASKYIADKTTLLVIYKIGHYFFFFVIILTTSSIWRNRIFQEFTNRRWRLADNAILYSLLALPVSCLMLKVCNYDASNIYFSILGISLIIAGEKNNNLKYAYYGTIATLFGCMDKWPGMIYWYISVILFVYIGIRKEIAWWKKIFKGIVLCMGAIISAIGISLFNLIYIFGLEGKVYSAINEGYVLFPITYVIRQYVLREGSLGIDYADEMAYCNQTIECLIALFLIIFLGGICLCIIDNLDRKYSEKLYSVISILNVLLLVISVICGIFGAYFVPQYWAPYREIPQGFFESKDSFDGITYHYGCRSNIGHFIYKLCYAYAVILSNYPTVILILFGVTIFFFFRTRSNTSAHERFMHIIMLITLIQPILFSIAGLPAGARYYGYTMIMQVIICCYFLCAKMENKINIKICTIIMGCFLGYIVEMIQFIPNIAIFSPIWIVHSENYKESIRKGTWYAGEAMTWGEDMAIAGRIIKEKMNEVEIEDYSSISIYGNYGTVWLNNPGFNIGYINKGAGVENYRWDDSEYMVLSKFRLFRYDIPQFIYEVEPVATIKYNGEISSWIYTGSQLKEYREYFK